MKNISFITRGLNFSKSGRNNLKGLEKSLEHDLRLGENQDKKMNHDRENENKVWLYNSDGELTHTLNTDHKQNGVKVANFVLQRTSIPEAKPDQEISDAEIKKIQNRISATRTKFRKYKGNESELNLFSRLADLSISMDEMKKIRDEYAELQDCRRHKQKLTQIENMISLHDQLEAATPEHRIDRRVANLSTACHTLFLKIPAKNSVSHKTISIDDYNNFISNFWKSHFPDHPLVTTIGHTDERSLVDGLEGTGDHLHVYVQGRNKTTGKMDFLKCQVDWASKYLSEHNPELLKTESKLRDKSISELGEIITESARKQRVNEIEGRFRGRVWQEAMRIEINAKLFNDKGLNAVFGYKTRTDPELVNDASKKQPDRIYNRINHKKEIIQNLDDSIKHKTSELKQIRNKVNDSLEEELKAKRRLAETRATRFELIASVKRVARFKQEIEAWMTTITEKFAHGLSEAFERHLELGSYATARSISELGDRHEDAIRKRSAEDPTDFDEKMATAIISASDDLIAKQIMSKTGSVALLEESKRLRPSIGRRQPKKTP